MTDIAMLDAVRGFNRFYTNKLGLLAKGYLDTDYTLTEARILYEIGARKRLSATELNRELGLDPAYLSRILKKFREAGFIENEPDPADGRSQILTVTTKGRAEFEMLGELSRRQIAADLDGIEDTRRQALIGAMNTIRATLDPSMPAGPAIIRPHRVGDIGWIIEAQAKAYTAEYGWNEKFEGLVAEVAGKFLTNFNPERERCWIAERNGQRVGSIVAADGGDGIAKLRLLYLSPEARGLGLGRMLVEECIRFAKLAGYRQISLWTNDILTAAIHIYMKAGFRLVSEERHAMFGPECNGQTWVLDLSEAKLSA